MTTTLKHDGFGHYLMAKTTHTSRQHVQYIFRFENDYGASVVKGMGTYGHELDLWELGVITFDGCDWHLTYDTPITEDVIGYLTDEQVMDILKQIQAL